MNWLDLELAILCVLLILLALLQRKIIMRLQEQIVVEPLTGLLNRRAFESAFTKLLELMPSHRGNRRPSMDAISLIVIDLDWFKKINDTFGHSVGDEVLKKIARCLKKTLRESDLVCRWGGEEFVVALPGVYEPEAMEVAEKIRKVISDTTFSVSALVVTASIGVTATKRWVPLDDLFGRADGAMYEAKNKGRNCVVANYI